MGSDSSHIAVLLFKLEACCRIQENKSTVTSQLCKWNRSRKSDEPSSLIYINFKRPEKDDLLQEPLDENGEAKYAVKRFRSSQVSISLENFQQLKQLVPNAPFFKTVNLDEQMNKNLMNPLLIRILMLPMILSLIVFQNC